MRSMRFHEKNHGNHDESKPLACCISETPWYYWVFDVCYNYSQSHV